MPGWLHRLREWATRNPVSRVDDPVLGKLLINESYWECTVTSQSGPIVLGIGGRYEPDPALIETARATLSSIDAFVDSVTEYLQTESHQAAWEPLADEIRALTIHDINYWWPKRPRSGMICFNCPDECGLWRCDVDEGSFSGLTFDS